MSRLNRETFQRLSSLRRREAKVLLDAKHYAASYYLMGYAVECALKACLTKQIQQYDFPDKRLLKDAYTHDLQRLIRLSGHGADFEKEIRQSPDFRLNWAVVKDWSESKRYDLEISRADARDLYLACMTRGAGILGWVRNRW